jgi:hypothetical protein
VIRPLAAARKRVLARHLGLSQLNISKPQQRTLHALAQGGRIILERDERGGIVEAECWTRDGWLLSDCTVAVFKSLKGKRLIASREGGPYHITREGLVRLRPQLNNRTSSKRL